MDERTVKLQKLYDQYMAEFSGNGYKDEFIADGTMCECNFGGMMIIIGASEDSCIVWSDWADAAVSDELTECEITFEENKDAEKDEEGDYPLQAGFNFNDIFYSLDNFMKI